VREDIWWRLEMVLRQIRKIIVSCERTQIRMHRFRTYEVRKSRDSPGKQPLKLCMCMNLNINNINNNNFNYTVTNAAYVSHNNVYNPSTNTKKESIEHGLQTVQRHYQNARMQNRPLYWLRKVPLQRSHIVSLLIFSFLIIIIMELETKAMTTSSQCDTGRTCLSLPIITRENTSIAVHVVQKKTIIHPLKIGKFAVWNLILCTGAIWRRIEKFEHRCTTTDHLL